MLVIDTKCVQNKSKTMKLAIIGSRSIQIDNIKKYIPENTTEIVSGGAKGADTCAERYATEFGIKLTVFYLNTLNLEEQRL